MTPADEGHASPTVLVRVLNDVGRGFLDFAHINVLAVLCLLLLGILVVIRILRRRKVNAMDALKTFFALFGFGSGLLIFAVFLLTTPPAYEKLSEDARVLAGGATVIVLCGVGFNEVRAFLKKR